MSCLMFDDEAVAGLIPDQSADWVVENKTLWPNMTLSANSCTAIKTADVSKSGYTPIGVVGWLFNGTNANCLSYSKMSISGDTLTYLIANNGNSSANGVDCIACVLYHKTY